MPTQRCFPLCSPEIPSRLHFCDLLLVPGVFPTQGARSASMGARVLSDGDLTSAPTLTPESQRREAGGRMCLVSHPDPQFIIRKKASVITQISGQKAGWAGLCQAILRWGEGNTQVLHS